MAVPLILYLLLSLKSFLNLKKSMGVNFNRSKIFLLYFYNAYGVALVGRKLRQRYDLFMQNKSLYRISSFNEKILDTTEQ